MTVRITHRAGVGDWPYGAVVHLEDRRAQRLIHNGYAEPTPETPIRTGKGRRAAAEAH